MDNFHSILILTFEKSCRNCRQKPSDESELQSSVLERYVISRNRTWGLRVLGIEGESTIDLSALLPSLQIWSRYTLPIIHRQKRNQNWKWATKPISGFSTLFAVVPLILRHEHADMNNTLLPFPVPFPHNNAWITLMPTHTRSNQSTHISSFHIVWRIDKVEETDQHPSAWHDQPGLRALQTIHLFLDVQFCWSVQKEWQIVR